jgi:hypothetical protein
MRHLISPLVLGFLVLSGGSALAQTPCQGGTQAAPACSRDWSAASLVVQVCPATATTEPGVKLVLRELNDAPLLSVLGAAGTNVTLPTSSAPLAAPATPTRIIKFACEDSSSRVGTDTFVSVTFPIRRAPQAPLLP